MTHKVVSDSDYSSFAEFAPILGIFGRKMGAIENICKSSIDLLKKFLWRENSNFSSKEIKL